MKIIEISPHRRLKKRIRITLTIFMVCLLLSGLTAFPLETELAFLDRIFSSNSVVGEWINQTYNGISTSNNAFPFLAYGTDWLAFAHIILAIVFIGPLRDPARNIWVIEFGIISCLLIFPVAFIAGSIRGIPLFWQLIDCSFGVIGLIPLVLCYRWIKVLSDRN